MSKNIFGSIFLGAAKEYGKAVVTAEMKTIKANNSKEFYAQLVLTGSHFFKLLSSATKSKVVSQVSEIFTEPIEQEIATDNI